MHLRTVDDELARLRHENAALRAELAAAREAAGTPSPEARAAAAEGRARAIIEQAMFSVQVLAPDGRTTAVNHAWERLWGATLADLEAIGYNMLEDAQLEVRGIMPYIRRGFAGEAVAIPVIRYDTAETGLGEVDRYVRAFIFPVRGPDGTVREVVLMHEDVTNETRAEQALQEANRRLAEQAAALEAEVSRRTRELEAQKAMTDRIVRHAPVAMAYFDRDLVYRWSNDRHAQVFGQAVAGRPIVEVVVPETFARTRPFYDQVLRTGEAAHLAAVPGHDGRSYWDTSYVPVADEDGAVQGVLVLAVDVTHRLEHERLRDAQIAALREADRAKDEFLSVISHELRTPLNFITGFASILDDEIHGPLVDGQRVAVERILAGADRMLLLVDDLLDVAKMQSDHLELAPEATAYGALVDEVLGQLKPLADRKALEIGTEVATGLTALVDPPRVAQVLTNLVNNAIKFTGRGGAIRVIATVRDGALVTEVRDTGVGIAPDQHDKLFKRFQQLDMSNTRQAGGTGLGLAISKAIVEAHGGRIGVHSAPGEGSTFWFSLPLAPDRSTPGDPASRP